MTASSPIPTAQIVKIVHGKTTRHITVKCPYCNKRHFHGWPYGPGDPGHRSAHCLGKHRPGRGYNIAPPEEDS